MAVVVVVVGCLATFRDGWQGGTSPSFLWTLAASKPPTGSRSDGGRRCPTSGPRSQTRVFHGRNGHRRSCYRILDRASFFVLKRRWLQALTATATQGRPRALCLGLFGSVGTGRHGSGRRSLASSEGALLSGGGTIATFTSRGVFGGNQASIETVKVVDSVDIIRVVAVVAAIVVIRILVILVWMKLDASSTTRVDCLFLGTSHGSLVLWGVLWQSTEIRDQGKQHTITLECSLLVSASALLTVAIGFHSSCCPVEVRCAVAEGAVPAPKRATSNQATNQPKQSSDKPGKDQAGDFLSVGCRQSILPSLSLRCRAWAMAVLGRLCGHSLEAPRAPDTLLATKSRTAAPQCPHQICRRARASPAFPFLLPKLDY